MSETHVRKLFLNLAVGDLQRSMAFFSTLGFEFDPRYTDENAACLIVNPEAYVMLLRSEFFRTFTRRQPCDTTWQTEGMFALSCPSRAEVDRLADRALGAGATQAMDPQDLGFMYGRSFYDPDGHHWEVFWMDPDGAVKVSG